MSLSVERQRGELPDDRRSPAWLTLAAWIALSAAAGAVGAIASVNSREFYASLERSPWAPPGEVFGPVWTTLYVLMGIAAWLVWRTRPTTTADRTVRRRALTLFVGQLALNALWTWLFFAWRQGAAAFGEIVLLWIAVALTTWYFGRVRPLAAYLLVPYLAWVTFATALTWAVWRANPGRL